MLKQSRDEELRRLASVVRDSNDAILLVDFEGNIHAWNRGAVRMYGYSEAEALKMNVVELVPSDLREKMREMLKQLQKGKLISSYETQRITKDGRVLDVWLTITMLGDDRGRPYMVATTERDITERNRIVVRLENTLKELQDRTEQLKTSAVELEVMNEELRSTNEELAESSQHLLDVSRVTIGYSYVISNTLEGPLKKLEDGIVALKNMVDKVDARRQVEALFRDSGEVSSIINDQSMLLYASSIEIHHSMVNLSDMAQSIVDELKAREPRSKVRFFIPQGITAYVDERLIEVAIRRILTNSWEHVRESDYGTVTMYSQFYGSEKLVAVYDNRREFVPGKFGFFSIPPWGGVELKDVDLGLMVANVIIERNGGRFWIDYEEDRGMDFCMALPSLLKSPL